MHKTHYKVCEEQRDCLQLFDLIMLFTFEMSHFHGETAIFVQNRYILIHKKKFTGHIFPIFFM